MDRNAILSEIRRLAEANGGVAVGRTRFEKLTGITEGVWLGKFWLSWGEAVSEAGFAPGKMQEAHAEEFLLECLANLTRSCGRFPTAAEIKMRRVNDKEFPNHGVFDRLGTKSAKIGRLREFGKKRSAYADILDLLPEVKFSSVESELAGEVAQQGDGYVYMLRLDKHFKIGKTFAVPRRHREIALELPEKPEVVHAIRTDDPSGIEAYWHARFADRRTNGEWFLLRPEDVRVFKRRKFM
ncbi:GIY-YIG nuclease family protein [Ramlibacter sp. 2FC]|uniref:GIY-YIG nuclease family protein n=1 Tax=Ramlibacter sp. 2FC TaxID=2502188 RepID=UPI0010F54E42|nr:GIY-YIG nuclease family protein [Ramlibacter sp. 2FC]